MNEGLDRIIKQLEDARKTTDKGGNYWMAREIMGILGYSNWDNFQKVIAKARVACDNTGVDSKSQFLDTKTPIHGGRGAIQQAGDCFLTRYACYMVTLSADSNKPEVGVAKGYFVIQTRRQEISDNLTNEERRIIHRARVKDANRKLGEAAKNSGVTRYGLFQDAGYRGLYDMGVPEIKKVKEIPEKEDLLDCAGRTELAMNEFRITQTEDKLRRDCVKTERDAINTHGQVGREIRNTIARLGGTMPEKLPAEENVKKLESRRKKELGGKKKELPPPAEDL
jgi:DNA-damage-inducible protein D